MLSKSKVALYCAVFFIFGVITGCCAMKYCVTSVVDIVIETPTPSPSATPSPSPSPSPANNEDDPEFSDDYIRKHNLSIHRMEATKENKDSEHLLYENKKYLEDDFKFEPDKNPDGTPNYYGFTEEDHYLLAEAIAIEARGESYKHQMYVGSVILNRVESKDYPNTIKEVLMDTNYGIQYPIFHKDPRTWPKPTELNKAIAYELLKYGSVLPYNVRFQAPFKQGTTYESFTNNGSSGTTYFDF